MSEGDGSYNRAHDALMARQNSVISTRIVVHPRITELLEQIRGRISRARVWDEINLGGRHPDNVSSDIIAAFSSRINNA